MKIAIIHDDLMRKGGAEQVALALHKTFPNAPIYTLCYDPDNTYPEFRNADVRTSIYQLIAKNESIMKLLFYPFGYWSMRLLKIDGYDKVILSSTYASKYANIAKGIEVINYCHNPFRLAWYPESYDLFAKARGVKKLILDLVISRLKKIDYRFSRKCDKTVVNSNLVADRVKKIYNIESTCTINPPVNLDNFKISPKKGDYYLVVSRLEDYKRVDIVIDAFNTMRKKLVIVGDGSKRKNLMNIAKSNVEFKKGIPSEQLKIIYSQAKALIFPQLEDFGITPLEANASGTPVIGYGKGGLTETMVPFPSDNPTAIFFYDQSSQAINDAVISFEKNEGNFKSTALLENAKRFSTSSFTEKIIRVLNDS